MAKKLTYAQLAQRVKELEKKIKTHEQTAKSLQSSEFRFREIFNNSKNGIAVYRAVNDGEDFQFVDFNPAGEMIDHITRKDVIGKSIEEIFPGIKEFGLYDVLNRVFTTGESERYPVARYEDKRITGWRDNFIYRLPSGEVVAIYTDETDRMKAEQALQESYEKMEAVLFSLPTGIMIIDARTDEIIEVNPQVISMVGSPIERIVGCKYQDFIRPVAAGHCTVADFGIPMNSSEHVLVTAGKKKIPIHKTAIPLTLGDRECTIESFFDISEHKNTEAERVQKEKLQGIVEMAGAVCHEMNQPLQIIAGLSELLTLELEGYDLSLDRINKIKTQIARMGKITRRLMTVTKYETKSYPDGKIIDIKRAAS